MYSIGDLPALSSFYLPLFLFKKNPILALIDSDSPGSYRDYKLLGGASGVMVIVAGIGHGDTSSNPGLIAFHIALIPLGKV